MDCGVVATRLRQFVADEGASSRLDDPMTSMSLAFVRWLMEVCSNFIVFDADDYIEATHRSSGITDLANDSMLMAQG